LHETTLAHLGQKDRAEKRRRLEAALGFLDTARQALDSTQSEPLAQWYEGDRVFGFAGLRQKLQQEISR
jgi:hypothetical protein